MSENACVNCKFDMKVHFRNLTRTPKFDVFLKTIKILRTVYFSSRNWKKNNV